ncbi:MAG: type II secretion system protein GspN [Proteobacteria bacterium]|nr:type II secretion system protein GspN [Pseudomonadota bacterium]
MKTKKWIAYTIYGILVTVVFLYWCFPSDNVADYIESTVTANNPNITLSIDSVKLSFPPGIRLNNLLVGFKDKPGSTLKANILRIRPGLAKLLRGRLSLLLGVDTCKGNIKGRLNFTNLFSVEGHVNAKAKVDNIDIGSCSYLKTLLGRQVTGKLKGSLIYNGNKELTNGAGSAEFVLLDGSIQLLKEVFGFDKLVFDAIETDMVLKNRILKMNRLNLSGKQLRGSLNGNIFLDNDITRSRLDIKGNVVIPALNRKLSVVIKGTITNPEAKFM